MGLLDRLEHALTRLIEGSLMGACFGGLHPVALAGRMLAAVEDRRRIGWGRTFVPNALTVTLAPADHAALTGLGEAALGEIVRSLAQELADRGHTVLGPVTVAWVADANVPPGEAVLTALFRTREAEGSERADPVAILGIVEGFGAGRHCAVPVEGVTIGRGSDNALVVPDPKMSRRHARIAAGPEGITLEDLGSRHGTLVNGRQVTLPVTLADGDRMTAGYTALEVLIL